MLALMRAGIGLGAWWLVALLSVVVFPVTAAPLRAPERVINGQTVNLNPLFQWWTNHHGARPLSAWVHVTGPVVGTNEWGWVVEAQIASADRSKKPDSDSAPGGSPRVLLLNPPLQDQAAFELLSSRLKILNQQRAVLSAQAAQLKQRDEALTNEQNALYQNRVQRRALAQTTRQLHQLEKEAKSELKQLDQQIRELKAKRASYTTSENYVLDCFALDMRQEVSGMPVYDHGRLNY